ncbi:MAG: class II aldolase/adducin family protein [Candidatus Baltobacteraceae bacterium]
MPKGHKRTREAIVSICARLSIRGLVAGTSGNVSVRLADGTILVTPTGLSLRALRPNQLAHIDAAGAYVAEGPRATSELPLHLAAYRARADICCVVHTHPTACTAWSKSGALFPLDTVGAAESLGPIAFVAYRRPGSAELAEACALALGGADAVLMERHGLSAVAGDLERAFEITDLAEQTAAIELGVAMLAKVRPTGEA